MLDALWWDTEHVPSCPADNDPSVAVAAYVNHSDNPHSMDQAIARFGSKGNLIVAINSHANANANVLDVENGAVNPSDKTSIVNWVAEQREAGTIAPTIYMNSSTWPLIKSYFPVNAYPWWWVANWKTPPEPGPWPGATAGHQYGGTGGYDLSTMTDEWVDEFMTAPTVAEIWAQPIVVPHMWDTNPDRVNYNGSQPASWVLSQVLSIVTASTCTQNADGSITVAKVGSGQGGTFSLQDLINVLNAPGYKES